MDSDRCVRCGREREPEGGRTKSRDFGLQGVGPMDSAWAELESGLVCPNCQTDVEQRQIGERLIRSIELEIERKQSEGEAPDAREVALLSYVLALRAEHAAGTREGSAHRNVEESPEQNVAAIHKERRLKVAITGAFLTGRPLVVHLDEYGALRRALARELKGPHWRVGGDSVGAGTYQSGGGFSEDLPLVIAQRGGTDLVLDLSRELEQNGPDLAPTLRRFEPLVRATAQELVVDVYDLGVAVLTAWIEVVVAAGADLPAAARAVKRLAWMRMEDEPVSPLVTGLREVAATVAREYGDAVRTVAPQELRAAAWLARADEPRDVDDENPPQESGRLLWLHPVHVYPASELDALTTATSLAPAFHETLPVDGGVFAAGIGSSAVVVSGRSDAAAVPVRLTRLHWAYYALYMEMDRGLLRVLNQWRWRKPAHLKDLERDARDVFADYLRIMDARARLDSALSSRGGDELAIWETIAKVQRFDAIVEAVERKLAVLDKVAQRRVVEATEERSRTLNIVALSFTFLTIVTVTIAVVGATAGSPTAPSFPLWVRILVVCLATTFTFGLWLIIYARSKRIRSERR